MEILVLHPGALGDIVLSLPTLALIRARQPDARLTIAGNRDFLDAVATGYADRILSISALPLHRLHAGLGLPAADLRFWKGFDRILSWTGAGDAAFETALKSANAGARFGCWRPSAGETRHVTRLFAGILDGWFDPLPPLDTPRVTVPPAVRAEARAWLHSWHLDPGESMIALHAGAGSAGKRWPLSRFGGLAGSIASRGGCRLLLVEGPAEAGTCEALRQSLPPEMVIPAANLPLPLLAGILQRCDAYVGNDSGISHLAAALGVPSVVLFGPTRPEHWAPQGSGVTVLRREGRCAGCSGGSAARHTCLETLGPDVVRDALNCAAAAGRASCPSGLA